MPPRPLALIAAVLVLLSPMLAAAHIDHGAPGLALKLERVDRQGASLQIALAIENAGEGVLTLKAITTDLGLVTILDGGTEIAAGSTTHLTLGLEVAGDMPGLFTLIADFGPAGAGPLLIFTGA
jgi:hypothetical protein